jgi:hypothetical protein
MNTEGSLLSSYNHHRSLLVFQASGAQSSPLHSITVRLILVVSYHFTSRSPQQSLPLGYPDQNFLIAMVLATTP